MSTSIEKVIKRIGVKSKNLPKEGNISFTYIDLWGEEEIGILKWDRNFDIELSYSSTKNNKKYNINFNADNRNEHSDIIKEFKADCLGKAPKFSWIEQEKAIPEHINSLKIKGP